MRYDDLAAALARSKAGLPPLQRIMRLIEDGVIDALQRDGSPYKMPQVLRFAGVGADDDFS